MTSFQDNPELHNQFLKMMSHFSTFDIGGLNLSQIPPVKGKDQKINFYVGFLSNKGKKFLKGKESVNSLDIAFPPRYSDDIKYFISFSASTPTYVKLSKKSIR